ncbi:MAG TPA: hypothetical protein VMX17_06145 [Candidatus Glassbacteria bacterium]|nr:hypothetical protein [Candidatus Glassbacteria bacterium]
MKKAILLVIMLLLVSCSSATPVTKQQTLTCYDYESCKRSCNSYDKKEDCKQLRFYK